MHRESARLVNTKQDNFRKVTIEFASNVISTETSHVNCEFRCCKQLVERFGHAPLLALTTPCYVRVIAIAKSVRSNYGCCSVQFDRQLLNVTSSDGPNCDFSR